MVAMIRSSLAFVGALSTLITTTCAAGTFTPEAMLGVSRRSGAIPNAEGTLAIYTANQYNFTTHTRSYEVSVYDLMTGVTTLFSNSSAASNPVWLGEGSKIVWFQSEDDGSTSVLLGDALLPGAEPITAGSIPGSADGLKIVKTGPGNYGVAFFGSASPNGSIYNSNLQETRLSSGRMYTSIFVRHWDTYLTPQRNSIWYTTLSASSNGSYTNSSSSYTLGEPINALQGSGLESPIPPMGGSDNYDIGPNGIVFISKDPALNAATTTKSDVYFLPLKSFTESPPAPVQVSTPGLEGASSTPVFGPNGVSVGFVRMKDISYESDKNRLLLVSDITKSTEAAEFYATANGVGAWDRSPTSVTWSTDGKSLYLPTEDYGRLRLFSIAADPTVTALPKIIYADYVIDVHPVASGKILVNGAGFLDNSVYSWIDPVLSESTNATSGVTLINANLGFGAKWGLSRSQISEVYYQGDGDYMVQAWVIKPSFYEEGKKYPLFFYVHGGPQGSTDDAWSNRWNMMVYAEQGYIVVAFNPTGSIGWGQQLCDQIQNEWGGKPYNDLVLGYQYIEQHLPFVDLDNAVEAGASYGGYMTFWIAGHDLGKKFKAQFAHDGSFNTLAQYTSEELWFMQHDFNGTLWDNFENYQRWNPAAHTKNWTTPMLIVHNELDYRLPIAEGLAAFNVLQAKGVPSKFLSFPDENHWVLRPENSLVWHKTVLDWLNGFVGLEAVSRPDDEGYRATLQSGPWFLSAGEGNVSILN
ncbi:hypothetical protein HYFRA_00012851 [Hymenoscyphus fraxineus]|uniref:Dipeptidyl-peptidase V n=1 Tax=Hymenoscyphus fraxineus TaxID=746836 RepID=A0A9N9L7D8_9HELO|nr:hypothetical protein HYFRA_00012851 [Hymenoscyphus fraxineus]